jgi:hypothetical protein
MKVWTIKFLITYAFPNLHATCSTVGINVLLLHILSAYLILLELEDKAHKGVKLRLTYHILITYEALGSHIIHMDIKCIVCAKKLKEGTPKPNHPIRVIRHLCPHNSKPETTVS